MTDIRTFSGYAVFAKETAIYPGRGDLMGLLYAVIGLGGEAGELLNKVKKILRDQNGIIREDIAKAIAGEVGDCLWYLNAICDELGFTLGDVANANIAKLALRKAEGKIGGSGDNR